MKQNRFGETINNTVKMQSSSRCGSNFLNKKQLNMVLFENEASQAGPAQDPWPPKPSPFGFRPFRLGLGGWGRGWAGGPRVLGRADLVCDTLKNHDSDKDVNIMSKDLTLMGMLIQYLVGPFSKSTIFNCF